MESITDTFSKLLFVRTFSLSNAYGFTSPMMTCDNTTFIGENLIINYQNS